MSTAEFSGGRPGMLGCIAVLGIAMLPFRSPAAAPPPADSATVLLLHCDRLPLWDAGPNHLAVRVHSGIPKLVQGRFGKAWLSTRNGAAAAVRIPAALQPRQALTLEAWVYIDAVTRDKVQWIAARNGVYGFYLSGTPAVPRLTWFLKLRSRKWNALTVRVPAKQWLHIAGTYDGRATALWVHGKQAAVRRCPGLPAVSSQSFVLGADEKNQHRFLGRLDEIRFSNVARREFMTAKSPVASRGARTAGPAGPRTAAAAPSQSRPLPTPPPPGPAPRPGNLLLNPKFAFHAFINHRLGKPVSYRSHNVAFWNTDAWGDITVVREANAPGNIRPPFSTGALVRIEPGKRFHQFIPLPEAGLAHGDRISLHVYGFQEQPGALSARIRMLKLDSEDGDWRPADYGMADRRTFPRHARGELVACAVHETHSPRTGRVELRIDGAAIPGRFHPDSPNRSYSNDVNTIAVDIEFFNAGSDQPVWIWWPSLALGDRAQARLLPLRSMVPAYRAIPRTIQKLWKGEAIHILVMGSSIDRGSANPPMYLYDENPNSPTFKQPLSDRVFEPERVGRPDLAGYVGWWQHYWDFAGRLRLELLRKFDLPVSKVCLNFMACDGSCVAEAHSGLAAYCALSLPPDPALNGNGAGKSWQELYPDLFRRPEGPGPDLVIFGSGANEKYDTPDEGAIFEGTIRWIQRHYPQAEFLFAMFQNHGGYTPNAGDLQAISLRYGIPMMDAGKLLDDVTRWCNRYALVPRDGHPQAAAHYLWFKALEKAFECWDPILPGIPQQYLPERLYSTTYGWEGEIRTFPADSPRIHDRRFFIFEDTAVNCWGAVDAGTPVPYVDGVKHRSRRSFPRRDLRNSMFAWGRTTLGDRHILEIAGKNARLTAVDAKVCPNRRFFGVDSPEWDLGGMKAIPFASQWGAPYGARQVRLPPGRELRIAVAGTDLSVAYVDSPDAGVLEVSVDGKERVVKIPADRPFVDAAGRKHFLEDRKGILGLPWGVHEVRLRALHKPVAVLGLFTYDSRPNRRAERCFSGLAVAGETVSFSQPFRARPLVLCSGGLRVRLRDVARDHVTFSGRGQGSFQVVGE